MSNGRIAFLTQRFLRFIQKQMKAPTHFQHTVPTYSFRNKKYSSYQLLFSDKQDSISVSLRQFGKLINRKSGGGVDL